MRHARALLVLTALCGLLAFSTGFTVFFRLLYVFAFALLLSYLWVRLLLASVKVRVRRSSNRTEAGRQVQETVIISRRGWLPGGLAEVREQTDLPGPKPGIIVGLAGGGVSRHELTLDCRRRGVYTLGPILVAASDPFGLFKIERKAGDTQQLIVHPATVELPGFQLSPSYMSGDGRIHHMTPNVTTDAYGIRDYVNGDSLNRMAWKSTARHGKLMVKEFEIEPSNSIWVLLDMEEKAHSGPDETGTEETSVTIAASICKHYAQAGFPVGLVAQGETHQLISARRGPQQLLRLMDTLAAIRAKGNAPLLEAMSSAYDRFNRNTSVLLITPSTEESWLAGVQHLLQRRIAVTAVLVKTGGDPSPLPHRLVSMGVTTYSVKAGSDISQELVQVTAGRWGQTVAN